MDLSEHHKAVLRHMLGIKKAIDKPWRNHFVASDSHDDMPVLNELLVGGYVVVRDDPRSSGYLFRATDKGCAAIGVEVRPNV